MNRTLQKWMNSIHAIEVPEKELGTAIDQAIARAQRDKRKKHPHPMHRIKRWLSYSAATLIVSSLIFGFSPDTRALATDLTSQIYQFVYAKTHTTANGLIQVGDQQLTPEEYELLFYTPVKTDQGYSLQRKNDIKVQLQHGEMELQSSLHQAEAVSGISLTTTIDRIQATMPEKLKQTLPQIYASGKGIALQYGYSSAEDPYTYVTITQPTEGFEILDMRQTITIKGKRATLGEMPVKVWDTDDHEARIRMDQVLRWNDPAGLEYRIAANGLSIDQLLHIAESML